MSTLAASAASRRPLQRTDASLPALRRGVRCKSERDYEHDMRHPIAAFGCMLFARWAPQVNASSRYRQRKARLTETNSSSEDQPAIGDSCNELTVPAATATTIFIHPDMLTPEQSTFASRLRALTPVDQGTQLCLQQC